MAVTDTSSEQVPVRVFGGPTALIEYGGLRFLTDPTFDAPGTYASGLTKTAPASAAPADLGRIDVVLLSHDEHDDNLDASGRALLADVPLTLTTPSGAGRLGGTARPLPDWESIELNRPGGGKITITGVPVTACPPSTSAATTPNSPWSARSPTASGRWTPPSCSPARSAPPSWIASCSPSTALRPPRWPASWAPAALCPSTSTAGPTSPRAASSWWTPSPPPA
jgi:hypothetical protein